MSYGDTEISSVLTFAVGVPKEMDLSVSGTALLTGAIDAIELTSDFDGQATVVALLQLET